MHLFIYLSRYQENLSMNYATLILILCYQSPTTFMSVHQQRRTMPLQSQQTYFVCVLLCFFKFNVTESEFQIQVCRSLFLELQKDKADCPIAHRGQPASAPHVAMDFRLLNFLRFDVAKRWAATKQHSNFHLGLVKLNKTTQ